jgi:spore coat polysaccharide biosynthesis protein SpsF
MKTVIGVITARMASTRLPGKVIRVLAGKTVFEHHVERMKNVVGLKGVYLATSTDPKNAVLIEEAKRLGCGWYAGSEEDIVERHVKLCEQADADAVIRVTSDCPLFNIDISSQFVVTFNEEDYDFIYCSNMSPVQGTVTELISRNALQKVHTTYRGPAISLPIREKMSEFKTCGIEIDASLVRPEYRLTLDEPEDLMVLQKIYDALYGGKPIPLPSVYTWLDDNPEVAVINRNILMKGVNQYNANLMEKPVYSIVQSGNNKLVILDVDKRVMDPQEFIQKIKSLLETGRIKY